MPAERVELMHRHDLEQAQDLFLAEKVARFVEQQPAPAEARLVRDIAKGELRARGVEFMQLEHLIEGAAGIDKARGLGRAYVHAFCRNFERIFFLSVTGHQVEFDPDLPLVFDVKGGQAPSQGGSEVFRDVRVALGTAHRDRAFQLQGAFAQAHFVGIRYNVKHIIHSDIIVIRINILYILTRPLVNKGNAAARIFSKKGRSFAKKRRPRRAFLRRKRRRFLLKLDIIEKKSVFFITNGINIRPCGA